MIGQTLKNRYRIESEIGGGAMGKVFRAIDQQSNDPVAVKVISEEFAGNDDYRKRFSRESQALRQLNHPNIVGYIDTFSMQNRACLVMEYFGGGTLQDMIEAHEGGMPDGLFKRVALAILDAMANAHEAGIIHRDLKPTNILMTADGAPKLADFGLAKLSQLSTMTASGMALGTLEYMSPEAFDSLTRQDHRGDIWSLGVILFQMLASQMPFRGQTDTQIIGSILHDPPYSLYTHRKDIPGDWVLIVEHCLQKEPGQRYQTTRDLLDDLRSDRASFHANAAPLDDYATLLDDRLGASPIQTPDNAAASKPDEGYQFQFLSGVENKPPPDRFKTEAPVRSIKNLLEPTPTSKTQRSASMMVFGGVLAWIGMLALVAAGLFSVFNLLQEEANRSVTPAALVMLAGTGATLFALGALLELPEADSQETILLGTMVFGAAMVCALIAVGSLLGDGGFLFAGVGAALSVALTVMYLSIKGF